MKILHLCLAGIFSEGYAYQENLLPKYHKKAGHDVEIIASTRSFTPEGVMTYLDPQQPYINSNGVRVVRLLYGKPLKLSRQLRFYVGLYDALSDFNPDIIFVHGIQFFDMNVVIRYVSKHPKVKMYVDNHADFMNSAQSYLSKKVMHEIVWRRIAQKSIKFTRKFYGVLPARVDFLIDVYKLPQAKCELLVMGADDELVEKAINHKKEGLVREKNGIDPDTFLIVTGGKLNRSRPEMLNLMEAVRSINERNIRLLVFGKADDEYKQRFEDLCKSSGIIYVGWQNSDKTYDLMGAGDLIVFPGLHSVMWEQAVALGVPCVFRQMDGFDHIDIGGNARFLKDVSTEIIENTIREIINNKQMYKEMFKVAQSDKRKQFMYSRIAEKAIETNQSEEGYR